MYTWTVLFLIDYAEGEMPVLQNMFRDILQNPITGGVGGIICISIPAGEVNSIDPGFKIPKGTASTDTITLFYSIELDRIAGDKSKLTLITNMGKGFNIKSKENVQQYFQTALQGGYEAGQYLLITWGHGAPFGIFFPGDIPDVDTPQAWDMLSMDDLKEAILGAFGDDPDKPRINVVIMMNCFQQFIETGYSLAAANVQYLVAPEAGIQFIGYNYSHLFNLLYTEPAVTPQQIAMEAVSSLSLMGPSDQDALSEAAIFANDLLVYKAMIPSINAFANALIAQMEIAPGPITSAILQCTPMKSSYDQRDLFGFIDALEITLGPQWQPAVISGIRAYKDQLIKAYFFGNKFPGPNTHYAAGCSIFLPSTPNRYFITYEDRQSPLADLFAKSSVWATFTAQLIQYILSQPGHKFPQPQP